MPTKKQASAMAREVTAPERARAACLAAAKNFAAHIPPSPASGRTVLMNEVPIYQKKFIASRRNTAMTTPKVPARSL